MSCQGCIYRPASQTRRQCNHRLVSFGVRNHRRPPGGELGGGVVTVLVGALRRVHVAVLAAAVLLTPVLAAAQALGTIAGTVKDASGAVLPGGTVEAARPALIEKGGT